MKLVLPPGVSTNDIRGVWIDNLPVDWQQEPDRGSDQAADSKNNIVSLPLPAAKQFPTISILFLTQGSGLATFGSLQPPLPEVELPVLASSWTVWLPPGYEFVGTDRRWQAQQGPDITYSKRLFGPFGRNPGQKAFNPLVADDWLALADDGPQLQTAPTKPAWNHDNLPGFQPADTQGWIVQRLQLSPVEPVIVKYVHQGSRRLWAAIIFLLTFAAGYWKAAKHPIFFSILAGIFGILTFILPEAYVPLASAAVLGMLAWGLLVIIQVNLKTGAPQITADQGSPDQSSPSASNSVPAAGRAGAVLLVIAASLFSAGNVRAEDAGEKSKAAASSDYRVFIPIDAEKKPVGQKVYLPEMFYNELYRRAAAAKEEPQGWLLGPAVYRGTLAREPAAGRLACEVIKAQFDLHVFGRMVQVTLPIRRENVQLIPDGATLDGRPIDPQWEADGAALKFEVQEPGDYRLELQFRPAPHCAWGLGGL